MRRRLVGPPRPAFSEQNPSLAIQADNTRKAP